MGIVCSLLLVILGTVSYVLVISFHIRNGKYSRTISWHLLLYGFFSALWCLSYGVIGFMENFDVCDVLRMIGVFSISAFLVNETFLVCKMVKPKPAIDIVIKVFMIIITIADCYIYSVRGVDLFFRVKGWTTWNFNPDFAFNRRVHDIFIFSAFTVLFLLALVWYYRDKLKRHRRFIRLMIIANCLIIVFSVADTYLPQMGYPALPTSGFGAALCTAVIWYGATQLNYFDIRMGNIADRFLDFIDAGIIVFDVERKAIITNNYCKRMAGSEEPSAVTIETIFDTDGLDEKEMFEFASDDIYSSRFYDKTHENAYSMRLNALKDDFGDPFCYLCVFADVTDEIRAIDKLEIASSAKSRFLAQMSHEIRTPINTVLGLNEMILRKSKDDEITEFSENIDSAGHTLLYLINSILDFSKIEDGRMEIVPVKYDTASFITDIINAIRQRTDDKGLEFREIIDENLPAGLMGDDVRLSQVIMNLLTNAVKFTKKGSVTFTMKTVSKTAEKVSVYVEVKDTGIGIKPEDIGRLSVSFERLDEKTNYSIGGSGLGISIVKELLGLMGSSLCVESVYGEGSVFSFTVDQEITDENPIGDYNDRLKRSRSLRKKEELVHAPDARILVVDDNKMNLKVAAQLLSLCDIKPDMANSGKEALEFMKNSTYDIVFMDHMMPEMDGIETLHELENGNLIPDETVMIVQTANAIVGMKEKYLEEGFADYLPKPVELKELSQMLKKYLPEKLMVEQRTEDDKADGPSSSDQDFPDIEGIEWERAFRNMPDKEQLRELLETFVDSAKDDIKELDRYYDDMSGGSDEKAIDLYKIKVHAMKNSAALVGAQELSDEAKALEYAARDHVEHFILDNHDGFKEHYVRTAGDISEKIFNRDFSSKEKMDNETLLKNIDLIEKAMADFDTNTLNNISFELGKFEFENADLENMIAALKEAVRDFDMEQFNKAVADIREMI